MSFGSAVRSLSGLAYSSKNASSRCLACCVVTDSQEALQLLQLGGRKAKARELVRSTLLAIDDAVAREMQITVLWTPAHAGIAGNAAAHSASQNATLSGCTPSRDVNIRIREKALVIGRLEDSEPWRCATRARDDVGRHTYNLDAALPGKHTLKLHGLLSRGDAGILPKARTGHTHLNSYLQRIGAAELAECDCGRASETVRHVLLDCERWNDERAKPAGGSGRAMGGCIIPPRRIQSSPGPSNLEEYRRSIIEVDFEPTHCVQDDSMPETDGTYGSASCHTLIRVPQIFNRRPKWPPSYLKCTMAPTALRSGYPVQLLSTNHDVGRHT